MATSKPPVQFYKSSFSQYTHNRCVEVGSDGSTIHVRHSQAPNDGVLKFTPAEWEAFIKGVKGGEFDNPAGA